MIIGITMYNEETDEFIHTIRGVQQGMIDIFKDEVEKNSL